MIKKIKEYITNLASRLLNPKEHYKIIRSYTYLILGIISLFMTAVNAITGDYYLMMATAIFGVACLLNLLIQRIGQYFDRIAAFLFGIEALALFTYFIVSGYPQGFSIIWLALMPQIALLFYGIKGGIILSGATFADLIFFLWVPFGRGLLRPEAANNYTDTFCLRFPLLYFACFALSLILELIKSIAYSKLTLVNKENKYVSVHDGLTGLYNRTGLREIIFNNLELTKSNKAYILIFDVDKFKNINDNWGHACGDYVLKEVAGIFSDKLDGFTCRYGGDEFAFISMDENFRKESIDEFKEFIENYEFMFGENKFHVTLSLGVYVANTKELMNPAECFQKADRALYYAKEHGRNQVKYF